MERSSARVRRQYEWTPWITPNVEHKATAGEDFDCTQASFVSLLHRRGDREGLSVETHTEGPDVYFTFKKLKRRRASR